MSHASTTDVQQLMDDIKLKATSKLVYYIGLLGLLSFPFSLYRTIETEWYTFSALLHYSAYLFAAVIYTLRERVHYNQVIYGLLVSGILMSYAEFTHFGLLGIGELTAMFSVLISLFYLGKKTTIAVALLMSAFYFYSKYHYVIQGRVLQIPVSEYLSSANAWLMVYVHALIFFFLIGVCTTYLNKMFLKLNQALADRNQKILEQNEKIQFLANHDALTGLPSLRVASDKMDKAIENARLNQQKCALLFVDLDGFKQVNDEFGHDAGDVLLQGIAERMNAEVSAADTVCRLGGDEFLVIVHSVESADHLQKLCANLVKSISKPYPFRGDELTVSASIGAASYPCCGDDANELRATADKLMYQVKKTGKNNYCIAAVADESVAVF